MSVLEAKHITKIYPGTTALDDVSVSFESGRVHALIGKNGSGKSTLVKIFSGAIRASSGSVSLDGKELDIRGPKDANDLGIATVYQELSLIPGMSIAENIYLDQLAEPGAFFNRKEIERKAKALLDEYQLNLDPAACVHELSMWQCQMVEILKAMSHKPRVIMLDEPTSSLSQNETELLFQMIRRLRTKDVVIIYISHRLQELWKIADTCTVLRDGKWIGFEEMSALSREALVAMMYGQVEVKTRPADLTIQPEKLVLEVKNFTSADHFRNVSFQLHEREILGIAGLLGSGRTELVRAIFGADPVDSGRLFLDGREIRGQSPSKMRDRGVALIPEDRKKQGLNQILSVRENLCLAGLPFLGRFGFVDARKERSWVQKQEKELMIRVPNMKLPVSSLSGGNQQKVVVGNWLNANPRIMLFDEPSRGIDVNAKQQIFQIIWEQSRRGVSSIIISSELEELVEVCHRILIMNNGEIKGEVMADEVKVEDLYAMCIGEAKS